LYIDTIFSTQISWFFYSVWGSTKQTVLWPGSVSIGVVFPARTARRLSRDGREVWEASPLRNSLGIAVNHFSPSATVSFDI
jgi:hypothetical protein